MFTPSGSNSDVVNVDACLPIETSALPLRETASSSPAGLTLLSVSAIVRRRRAVCVAEPSSPVNYDDAGEQPMAVVTPLVAALAVVNAFVMVLLGVAFITDTGSG